MSVLDVQDQAWRRRRAVWGRYQNSHGLTPQRMVAGPQDVETALRAELYEINQWERAQTAKAIGGGR